MNTTEQEVTLDGVRTGTEAAAAPSRRQQLWEVLAFLFLIVPSMALSFMVSSQGVGSFVLTAYATILRDLALVSLILFFLWRNREPVSRLGWTFRHAGREAGVGVAIFLPFFFITAYVEQLFRAAGLSAPSTPLPGFLAAAGWSEYLLASILVVVVAIAEETMFRGYLMLRFGAISRSAIAAAVLSSFVFSLGHGYEGTAGVATVGVMGFLFALVYLWRGSLVAPMVMHFLQDFIGIVVLPLLVHVH